MKTMDDFEVKNGTMHLSLLVQAVTPVTFGDGSEMISLTFKRMQGDDKRIEALEKLENKYIELYIPYEEE